MNDPHSNCWSFFSSYCIQARSFAAHLDSPDSIGWIIKRDSRKLIYLIKIIDVRRTCHYIRSESVLCALCIASFICSVCTNGIHMSDHLPPQNGFDKLAFTLACASYSSRCRYIITVAYRKR